MGKPMKISSMYVENFKSIKKLEINDIDSAFILVGKNNTGKSVVLDAVLAAFHNKIIDVALFHDPIKNIEIGITLDIEEEDLYSFHNFGLVSKNKRYEHWIEDFCDKFPGFKDGKLFFKYLINPNGKAVYFDEFNKRCDDIKIIFPRIYFLDHKRDVEKFQDELMKFSTTEAYSILSEGICMFDKTKKCNKCFNCIGLINKKTPEELNIYETARLMEYKVFNENLGDFADIVNKNLRENGANSLTVKYELCFDVEELFNIKTTINYNERNREGDLSSLSEGWKSIYLFSLLESYIEERRNYPIIIMIDDPEIYLHPQLQKEASEILYRLSKKNQIIFSTYSPNMIFNFSSKQIKQVIVDDEFNTSIVENPHIDSILNDLGYNANDMINVSFVFIVEGKQDKNRLPLLLERYYSEIRDEDGALKRISIIATNSCTNIKTYANLKYINKLYLKDQFLMIRDSDGKNPNYLVKQLCNYYAAREREETEAIPHVEPKNVLVLKYYSFENYFLDPEIMVKIGVIDSVNQFYNILFKKYKDSLYKHPTFKKLVRRRNLRFNSPEDIKKNIEMIKIYVRGHNLFDIFYGKYNEDEEEDLIRRYIEHAPRSVFEDILKAIDSFVYFENRKIN